MFNNIIYFIIVLLIFNISYPGSAQETSLSYSLGMHLLCWLLLLGYCQWGFRNLLTRFSKDEDVSGRLTGEYHGLILRLSIMAIFLFSLDVYIFNLKYWLQMIPGVKEFSTLQGVIAIMLFIFYLATIWYVAYPAYVVAFQARLKRRSFIISNLKLNVPILFPWFVLSLAFDLIMFSPWSGPDSFLGRTEGQMIFFALFLFVLMIFMPPIIQYWWGCKPFEPSDRMSELTSFLRGIRFRYRDLLRWPIFEGRMLTAGIMGIIPRYRYILMTDSLMEILSVEELKAVMAHEVGHARYRHLLFYVLFFLGCMVLLAGMFNFYPAIVEYFIHKYSINISTPNLYLIILFMPMLLTMLIYFRFIIGFFMRNFERQADLHSAVTMESPKPAISALEKIALLSGKSRELPSWHHFSIKQRVDYLWRFLKEPGLVRRHNRFVASSFFVYLICIIGLGYLLNFSTLKQNLTYGLVRQMLDQRLIKEPGNISLLQNLAMVYHNMERHREAIETYEKILLIDDSQSVVLNNLAWLLVTAPDKGLRDPERALILAKKAVELEMSPIYLDTLAEAYYVNGHIQKAIETIRKAISLSKGTDPYFKKQLKKFMESYQDT